MNVLSHRHTDDRLNHDISERSGFRLRLLLLSVCLCLTTVSGCGGCGNSMNFPTEEEARIARAKAAEAEPKSEAAKPKPLEAEKPPAPPPPVRKPPEPVTEAVLPTPKKPARPEDITDWKRDDYYSAKRDNDPRLAEAVANLGRRFVGNVNAAILLAKLIESPADDPFLSGNREEGGPRPENDAPDKLIQTIVNALAVNNTSHAHHTLKQLMTGTLKTSAPQTAALAALKALLERPNPKNEELLLRILTAASPESDEDRQAIDWGQLRQAALEPVRVAASESFRTRLAKGMLGSELSQEAFDGLWTCLKESKLENLPAQIILYQSGRLTPTDQEELQARLIERSGSVLDVLLRIRRSSPSTAQAVYRQASLLWDAEFAASIQRQLRSQPSIEKMGGRLSMLACTLPNPELRAAMLRFLQKHWEEGPKGLTPPNERNPTTLEPGFLVMLKLLPHKETGTAANGKDKPTRVDNRFMATTKAAKITEAREAKQRQDKTSKEWTAFTRNIVQSLCKKFQSASKSQTSSDAGAHDDVGLAFKPHPRAAIVAVYQLDWPKELRDKISAPPVLRVRYVRTEQKTTPSKVAAYYRRQLPECLEHAFPGCFWIEATSTDKTDAVTRSTDVIVSKASEAVPEMNDQEQELIVEILSIECAEIASPNTPNN